MAKLTITPSKNGESRGLASRRASECCEAPWFSFLSYTENGEVDDDSFEER